MKILFVSDTYYPHINGVYYFVCRLAPLLKNKGHQVAVIAPSESTRQTVKLIDDIVVYGMPSLPILYYPKLRFPMSFFLRKRLTQILDDFSPDMLHIQDHFILSKAVVALNQQYGIPIIGTNHFMPENLTSLFRSEKIKILLEKLMWKRFSRVFNQLQLVTTPSETAAALIRPKLNARVIAVSSGIDTGVFNPLSCTKNIRIKYGLPDKPILLYVGRLDPEKQIEEIFSAVARVNNLIDFILVIVGKGMKRHILEQEAKNACINSKVFFTGFVPDEDLPCFYKIARCFIIASTAELLSLAALQALACGCPVIAVRAGALAELVQDKINGWLYDAGDVTAMVQCIETILTDETIYIRMSVNSAASVRRHDITRTLLNFERIYQQQQKTKFRLLTFEHVG